MVLETVLRTGFRVFLGQKLQKCFKTCVMNMVLITIFCPQSTPTERGVVERKNRTLEDMTRTMLFASGLPKNFWVETLNTSCYIINRCMIRPILNKTPYELFKGRKPNIMHLRVFGCKYYVHNNGKEPLGKFDSRSDEAIFLRYSSHSKACKVFNKRTLCVEESVHVLFDETNSLIEHDAQDEEFELGLMRKDFSLTQSSMIDNGKAPEGKPSPDSGNVEGE